MKFITAYSDKPVIESVNRGKSYGEMEVTQQGQEKEANINNIMKRFSREDGFDWYDEWDGDAILEVAPKTLHDDMLIVTRAQHAFDALPSNVRNHCDNDPRKFLAFCQDEGNREKMIEFGLIPAPPVRARSAADAVRRAPGGDETLDAGSSSGPAVDQGPARDSS